jgi:hypothetical protein
MLLMKKKIITTTISTISIYLFALMFGSASASQILFDPKNTAFFSGVNPASTSALLSSVVRPEKPSSSSGYVPTSTADLIQQGVMSQISTKITTDIFKTTNPSGTYDLGDGSLISFDKNDTGVGITFISPTRGKTVITLPNGM